jgi:hypothetical protein
MKEMQPSKVLSLEMRITTSGASTIDSRIMHLLPLHSTIRHRVVAAAAAAAAATAAAAAAECN